MGERPGIGCAVVDLVTFADFASGFDCVSAGKVAIHAVGSGLRFKIADVDRGFAVGAEAAAPPSPGMSALCPVIAASGGDRKSTRMTSSHYCDARQTSSACNIKLVL